MAVVVGLSLTAAVVAVAGTEHGRFWKSSTALKEAQCGQKVVDIGLEFVGSDKSTDAEEYHGLLDPEPH